MKGGSVAKHGIAPIAVWVGALIAPRFARTRFLQMTGDADDLTRKRTFLLAPAAVAIATLAACGSSNGPSARDASKPMIYVSSQRARVYIASCLESRLSRVRLSRVGSATEIAVGFQRFALRSTLAHPRNWFGQATCGGSTNTQVLLHLVSGSTSHIGV
ncbi:hypothetical protein [Paraburkholderia podalyriae]|uniref:hypothetical protein n=1 Tax=Paraburkholderia TaxID=1822464 RepID=UPI0028AE4F56|nr:hypothetical protein [Paraburkholderia podalyriae]